MLEDCATTMEKKPLTRSGQAQGCESKKTQDVVGSKPTSRSRRREPSNSSTNKYETGRKPVPQKSKSFDKRPRPRGQHNGGGKEDSQVVSEDVAEYGSVFVPANKKQNLNHLLNFHYAPRAASATHTPVSEWGRSQRWLPSTHKHKYNKEHFLQANCQFVVKAGSDYSAYLSSPDTLVDWDLVEQIRVQSDETLSCPICLCPPVAGKMTRCGHVFCWPCILHYLALSDKTWRSCPICYEAVHKNALKSVVAAQHRPVSVGDEVTMLLMCRPRDSLVATPIGQAEGRASGHILSVSETAVDTIYSKLLLATPAEVAGLLASERAQLVEQLREEQGCPELCFTEQALQLLAERLDTLDTVASRETGDVASANNEQTLECAEALVNNFECEASAECETMEETPVALPGEIGQKRDRYVSVSSSDAGSAVFAAEDLEIHHPQAAPQKIFYFYQASDGQHVYLHAVNVRMLEMQYGALAQCPPVIRGRVLEKEAGSMSAELRRRLRYLQHLSVACPFEVAEIELRPPLMQPPILQHFQEQLEVRRRHRASRAKQERRREKQISAEEDRKMGRHPTARVHIQSTRHFPQWGTEAVAVSVSPRSVSPAESSAASSPRDPVSPLAAAVAALDIAAPPAQSAQLDPRRDPRHDSQHDAPAGFSFAQMLREGKGKPGAAPMRSSQKWPVAGGGRPRTASDSEPEPEGYVPAPSFSQSFSNAIALALEKAEAQAGGETVLGKQKKKKKNKKTLLFTTTMACTGK